MKREHTMLTRGASVISHDLARTVGIGWHCEVTDDERLRVTDGDGLTVDILIETDFDPEDALPAGALDSEWRDVELAADALTAVADALQEALAPVVGGWPLCPEHRRLLMVCSAVWVCGKGHDIAAVGDLPAPDRAP